MRVAVVVLAGGQARRWRGRDKTAVLLGTRTVLERAVAGLRTGVQAIVPDTDDTGFVTVVAGPDEHAARAALAAVRWVREEPPGGGPVAGLAAAVAVLPPEVDIVVVGAGDAPFGGSAVPRLLGALGGPEAEAADGAVGVDPGGRRQPLLGAYRTAALRGALGRLGDPAGVSLRALLGGLRILEVAVTDREALDLDTPDALDEALRQAEAGPTDVSCAAESS